MVHIDRDLDFKQFTVDFSNIAEFPQQALNLLHNNFPQAYSALHVDERVHRLNTYYVTGVGLV